MADMTRRRFVLLLAHGIGVLWDTGTTVEDGSYEWDVPMFDIFEFSRTRQIQKPQ